MDRVSHAMNLVGDTVAGKYKLQRVLGIGGMGAVYEAVHAYTGRRVALKVLGPDYASEHEAIERFLLEAQAPSSIGHPNIVEVLDAGEDPSVGVYVVLEYLDGEDLEAAVERGNLDVHALLDAVSQLLAALGAAHARGFVHRDIKPANVYLTRNPDGSRRVKLLDFGIAKNVARGITVGNAVMGTPHYMSPEQAQGKPVDPRADLWAVGALLYHALAGEAPFDGANANVIMVRIIVGEAPSLATRRPDLSKALIELVDRAMRKDLDARWPDAPTMAEALARVPERLGGGVLKISSTLRNRLGDASGLRATSPDTPAPTAPARPTPRTGTLDLDEAPAATPLTPPAAVAATVRAPSRRRAVIVAAVVGAAVAAVALGVTSRAPTASVAAPPRPASMAVPDAAAPRPVERPDASVAAPDGGPRTDAGPVAEAEPARGHGRRAHRRDHGADAAATASPSEPAAPAPTRIGGITIPRYKP